MFVTACYEIISFQKWPKYFISVTNRNKIFIQQYVRAFDVFNQMKRSRFLSVSLTLDHQMRLNVRTFSWPQTCLKI